MKLDEIRLFKTFLHKTVDILGFVWYNVYCKLAKVLTYKERSLKQMASKKDLIAKVAEATELTKKDSEAAVNAVFAAVSDFLVAGEKVQLIGFGNFEVRDRAERQGRNPQTGEPLTIAATKVPVFKAGKALKDAVK